MKIQNYFLSGVLCSFSCAFAAQNGTAVNLPHAQNGIMQPHSAAIPGALTAHQVVTTANSASRNKNIPYDGQNFLEKAADQQICETKAVVEGLRNLIDKKHLGIDEYSWFRSLRGSYASRCKAAELDISGAIAELQKIESYVSDECSSPVTYHSLAQRHWYVGALVSKLAQHEAEQLKRVKGSTIDTVFDPQRRIANLSLAMTAFVKQEVRSEIFDRVDSRLVDNHMFLEPDIQLVPLFANKRVNVNGGDLVTSTDSKYAKSTDVDGNIIIWDLENGCSANIADDNIQWERRRFREPYDPHVVIDGNDEHAIFTNVPRRRLLLTSYPRHIDFVKDFDNGGYLMVLFKKPTKESRLCREAFLNSRGNVEELHQLLNSEIFKKVTGFPAANLKFLINKELEALTNQQAKL